MRAELNRGCSPQTKNTRLIVLQIFENGSKRKETNYTQTRMKDHTRSPQKQDINDQKSFK